MEFKFDKNRIEFNRVLSELDNFVIRFVKLLDKCEIKYVVVSGYVSIVFGRSRQTEDVDLLIEELSYQKFCEFWDQVLKEFDCLNTDDLEEAYNTYIKENVALRFSEKDSFIPNIEFKIAKDADDVYSLRNSIELILSIYTIRISPIEFQIAYKMFLGSEKDFEDAKHLFNIFKDYINKPDLIAALDKFNIERKPIDEYLSGLL